MNIKIIKKIRIGSTAFFSSFPDFKPKDVDELCIMSESIKSKYKSFCIRGDKKDIILYPQLTKEEFIDVDIKSNDTLKVGKYLVPEFVDYIGLNINDLHKLKPLVDGLDEKHIYEKLIYDGYIQNKSFTLTDKQLEAAYNIYKKNKEYYHV